jgi:hypothetical protein
MLIGIDVCHSGP